MRAWARTQLALAVATALRRFGRLAPDHASDALLLRRGARSGIGLVCSSREVSLSMADMGRGPRRLRSSRAWISAAMAGGYRPRPRTEGVHGGEEQAPSPGSRISRPVWRAKSAGSFSSGIAGSGEQDIGAFGDAIARLQEIAGDYFAPAQGGAPYASAAVARVMMSFAAWGKRNRPIVLGPTALPSPPMLRRRSVCAISSRQRPPRRGSTSRSARELITASSSKGKVSRH